MKNIFGKWKLYEIIFLIGSIILVTLCFVFDTDKNVLSFIISLIGVVSVLMVAKGLTIAPMISVVYAILYSIMSILQHYYGEAIIYLGFMLPINILSIVSWLKNRNKEKSEVVEVNVIKKAEYLYLFVITIFATIGFYFLLKILNTDELVISTLALVSSAVASYLMLRRCSYYAVGFIVNDIILIVLWSMVVKSSGIGYLPTVISFFVFLINDIYGFIHWKIEENKQKQNNKGVKLI